jgi:hypothetical protein
LCYQFYASRNRSTERATKPALEPIHNKGVKLALGVFAICRTENALCEAGFPTLSEMRELNTTIVATRVLMNEWHPIRHLFTNCRIQDEYAKRKGTPSPIFMKTSDKFGELGVDTRKVETAPSYNRVLWMIDADKCLDFTMCSITNRTSREQSVAECTEIFTDGSLKDERVG